MKLIRFLSVYRSFVLIFLILILFVGSSIYGVKRMSQSLKHLQEHQSVSLQTSMQLRQIYRDLSFRMAAYCAQVLPARENQARLADSEAKLKLLWPRYFASIDETSLPLSAHELVAHLEESVRVSQHFLADLKSAYGQNDRRIVLKLLQDQWPKIQSSIMVPLDRLSQEHELAVQSSYDKALKMETYLTYFEISIFIVGAFVLLWIARRMKLLSLQYEQQVDLNVSSSRLAALGEMAGGIAHEINTPLTVIQISAEQIQRALKKDDWDPARVQKASEVIAKTTVRIDKIIKGLRSFARDGKNDPFQKESVQRIVEETLDLCREKFRNLNITLDLSLPEDPVFVDCRPTQIAQVLLNILNNSYDAIQKLPTKWIRLSVLTSEEQVEISVTDSGQGISKDVQDRLMEPFFTTKEIGRGMGLGLSVSRGIIQTHSGQLYYDSESENTRFVVRLPCRQVFPKPVLVASNISAVSQWTKVRSGLTAGIQFFL